MRTNSAKIIRTYLTLMLLTTFATSFIWGINTLFLLDAGLTITEAFAANAFYTVGQVLFEVPTGVVADTMGRRTSYLFGSATLFASTIFYLVLWQQHASFVWWAVASALLGLGFTFFSGAMEAWLVDALKATGYKGNLESVFGRGQVATGIAMLSGAVAGGVAAQFTNLGVPYIMRAVTLGLTFVVTLLIMRDVGFTPHKRKSIANEVARILRSSYNHGFRNPPVRWIMLSGPFVMGVGVYGFYAMQPYLLELYGNEQSYAVAGLAAAIVGGAQIGGGLIATKLHKVFAYRTSMLFALVALSAGTLALIGFVGNFWFVLVMLVLWAVAFAASFPVRQAYINGLIPSQERATILSSDNLLASAGGAGLQPVLGKAADVWGYSASYIVSAFFQILALPFLLLAKQQKAPSDPFDTEPKSQKPDEVPYTSA